MKKIMTSLVLIAMCMFSCTNDETDKLVQGNSKNGHRAYDLLEQINRENPMSEVGIKHNEFLTNFYGALKSKTRNSGFGTLTQFGIEDSLKQYGVHEIADAISEYGETQYTIQNFICDYDSIILPIARQNPKSIHLVTLQDKKQLGDKLYHGLFELENILKDENSDLESTLKKIHVLQNNSQNQINYDGQPLLYLACSVAANSCTYWSENLDDFCADFSISTPCINFKDAGVADVKSAIESVVSGGILVIAAKAAFSWQGVAVSAAVGSAVNVCEQLYDQYQSEMN